jgi:hypothetical protein
LPDDRFFARNQAGNDAICRSAESPFSLSSGYRQPEQFGFNDLPARFTQELYDSLDFDTPMPSRCFCHRNQIVIAPPFERGLANADGPGNLFGGGSFSHQIYLKSGEIELIELSNRSYFHGDIRGNKNTAGQFITGI